jgi:hypothetical protein
MTISVIYRDGTYGIVNSDELEELLQGGSLLSFQRANGWVKVGVDDLRDRSGTQSTSWKDRKEIVGRHQHPRLEN